MATRLRVLPTRRGLLYQVWSDRADPGHLVQESVSRPAPRRLGLDTRPGLRAPDLGNQRGPAPLHFSVQAAARSLDSGAVEWALSPGLDSKKAILL